MLAKRLQPTRAAALLSAGFMLLLFFGALHLTGIIAVLLFASWTIRTLIH